MLIRADKEGVMNMQGLRVSVATLSMTMVLFGAGTVAMAEQVLPVESPKQKKLPPASNAVRAEAVPRARKPVPVKSLGARRPDLQALPLSTENASKPLPHVDVAQSGSGQDKTREPLVKSKKPRS
jgi:hypothetical protein